MESKSHQGPGSGPVEHKAIISTGEAAAIAGVSPAILRRLVAARAFPQPLKAGRKMHFLRSDITRFLQGRRPGRCRVTLHADERPPAAAREGAKPGHADDALRRVLTQLQNSEDELVARWAARLLEGDGAGGVS